MVERKTKHTANLAYSMKLFVETMEDYKVGLEEHLYGGSAEIEKYVRDGDDFTISDYKISKLELSNIKDEIGRVRLFIDVFSKFLK